MECRTLGSTLTQRRTQTHVEEVPSSSAQVGEVRTGLRKMDIGGLFQECRVAPESDQNTGVGKVARKAATSATGVGEGAQEAATPLTGLGEGANGAACSDTTGLGEEASYAAPTGSSGLGERTWTIPSHVDEIQEHEVRIHPSWKPPRVPPRTLWQALPTWGGVQAMWHQPVPEFATKDEWLLDEARSVLIRFHCVSRLYLLDVRKIKLPDQCQPVRLSGRRRTFIKYLGHSGPKTEIIEDDFWRVGARKLTQSWVGRTELEISESSD